MALFCQGADDLSVFLGLPEAGHTGSGFITRYRIMEMACLHQCVYTQERNNRNHLLGICYDLASPKTRFILV